MRISREVMLEQLVTVIAQRSTCSRLHVGALVHREGRILVTGYNGAPSGLPHCTHDSNNTAPCIESVHAEANCIAWAARYGLSVEGAELITTHSPCRGCAQLIINSGISSVKYGELFRDTSSLAPMRMAGIKVGPIDDTL